MVAGADGGARRTAARGADVHDLLGLGLSAIALKADLIGTLISRTTSGSSQEVAEIAICAHAGASSWSPKS